MKRTFTSALIGALVMSGISPALAQETLWAPDDFTGAYVGVGDGAENGCWTNIGEAKTYATDQLELAGFQIIEPPTKATREPSASPSNNVTLIIEVRGRRWDNGACVGSLSVYFVGRVILLNNPGRWVRSAIGRPASMPIWDQNSFNTIILDQVKAFIASWVENGQLPDAAPH